MEKFSIENDLAVMGKQVTTFPKGIAEAFDGLAAMVGEERPFYGISWCIGNTITYIAAVLQHHHDEAKQLNLETYTIKKGNYIGFTVTDWVQKTGTIKQVFEEILRDERADPGTPAIEEYRNMNEMVCMVKTSERKELKYELTNAIEELRSLVTPLSEQQLNTVPFEGSWTAGQVLRHLGMSHAGFAAIMNGTVEETERSPTQWEEMIKTSFLDFTVKHQSPEFVYPENKQYNKERLLASLDKATADIYTVIETADLNKTCKLFPLPVLGYLTRIEAIFFVTSHTLRHIHQLKNIILKLSEKELNKTPAFV